MATYNGAEYLEEQLDTIRLQTREADELIYLLVIRHLTSPANSFLEKSFNPENFPESIYR